MALELHEEYLVASGEFIVPLRQEEDLNAYPVPFVANLYITLHEQVQKAEQFEKLVRSYLIGEIGEYGKPTGRLFSPDLAGTGAVETRSNGAVRYHVDADHWLEARPVLRTHFDEAKALAVLDRLGLLHEASTIRYVLKDSRVVEEAIHNGEKMVTVPVSAFETEAVVDPQKVEALAALGKIPEADLIAIFSPTTTYALYIGGAKKENTTKGGTARVHKS